MKKWIFWCIAIVAILLLWFFQSQITVNIPWWDDFHGIILPVHDLFTDKPLSWKLHNFFSLNNEHRVVNDRFFTVLIYIATGKFELKALAMLGFVNLIGIFLIVCRVLRQEKITYWAILPIVFLLFHAQYYESLQSLMVPFQNFSVILYMVLSIYSLIYLEKRYFLWGFIFAVLAIFSHGNGILVFILGGLLLLVNQKYKQSLVWAILSIITILVYFTGYTKPSWVNTDVISPTENPIAAIRYCFEFLGAYALNIVGTSSSLNVSAIKQLLPQVLGLTSLIALLFVVFKIYPLNHLKSSLEKLKASKSNQFFLAFIAFFIATGIIMGLTRTGFPVLSRYTINSSLFLIGLWGFYVVNLDSKGAKITSVVTFLMLLFSYYNAAQIGCFVKENTITDAINYQINGTWANGYSDSSHVSRVNPLLKEPLETESYVFPKSNLDQFNKWPSSKKRENLDYSIIDNYLMISGRNERSEEEIYFSLENDQYQFIFPIRKQRANLKDFALKRSYYSGFYNTAFPISVIPAGSYSIYKIRKEGEGFVKNNLDRQLETSGMIL